MLSNTHYVHTVRERRKTLGDMCNPPPHRRGGGRKLHPGLWKIPPRLLENPTQGFGKVLEHNLGFFKSLGGHH